MFAASLRMPNPRARRPTPQCPSPPPGFPDAVASCLHRETALATSPAVCRACAGVRRKYSATLSASSIDASPLCSSMSMDKCVAGIARELGSGRRPATIASLDCPHRESHDCASDRRYSRSEWRKQFSAIVHASLLWERHHTAESHLRSPDSCESRDPWRPAYSSPRETAVSPCLPGRSVAEERLDDQRLVRLWRLPFEPQQQQPGERRPLPIEPYEYGRCDEETWQSPIAHLDPARRLWDALRPAMNQAQATGGDPLRIPLRRRRFRWQQAEPGVRSMAVCDDPRPHAETARPLARQTAARPCRVSSSTRSR
jgi:hypothetical protein